MNVSSIALQGLNQAQDQLQSTARRIAGAGSPTDSVNLSDAAVSLITAKNDFEANLNTIKVDDQMQKSTINLLG